MDIAFEKGDKCEPNNKLLFGAYAKCWEELGEK